MSWEEREREAGRAREGAAPRGVHGSYLHKQLVTLQHTLEYVSMVIPSHLRLQLVEHYLE